MKTILLVDDNIIEFIALNAVLKKDKHPDVFIYWVPLLLNAGKVCSANVYNFDLAVVDVSGTAIGDFDQEFDGVKAEKIIATSNVLAPVKMDIEFVLKSNLHNWILTFLKELKENDSKSGN